MALISDSGTGIKKSHIILGVIALLLIICCWTCVSQRNGMVEDSQAVKKANGDIEADYQRRFDLIPNLVNTVKGYANHESEVLEKVTGMRTDNLPPDNPSPEALQNLENAQNELSEAYDTAGSEMTPEKAAATMQSQANLWDKYQIYVNAVHEAYPTLASADLFKNLQNQLEGTENRINTSRKKYNEAVEKYNNRVLKFPGSLFSWGYQEMQPYQSDPGASKAVKVSF